MPIPGWSDLDGFGWGWSDLRGRQLEGPSHLSQAVVLRTDVLCSSTISAVRSVGMVGHVYTHFTSSGHEECHLG